MSVVKADAHGFVEFALSQKVLRFGTFTLKSGRESPYFFNAGLFTTGEALSKLAEFYAQAIVDSGIEFDCLFGPAYKGISLAAIVSVALYQKHGRSVPYCYNRKEAKDHGEGGIIVGQMLPRVLCIDDVITAGTAIREAVSIVGAQSGCRIVGVVVAMDREELYREGSAQSAVQEVQAEYGIPVLSIAKMTHLISFLEQHYDGEDKEALVERVQGYRAQYGATGDAGRVANAGA